LKSDSIIDKKYRRVLKRLDKAMQKRNDIFMEKRLESLFFSFKTNKRIFKGVLMLSRLQNMTPLSTFIDNRFPNEINARDIQDLQQESLKRMIELLANGKDSDVMKAHPLGRYQRKAS
ncbi:MAG: hypothetical protein JSU90_06935, partial [Nitrospiraceae bacterium]